MSGESQIPAWHPPVWARALIYGIAYFAMAELGNALSVQHTFSTIWPPAGLAIGFLLLTRPRDWPLMLAAGALGNFASDLNHDRAALLSLGFIVANSSEAVLGAWLLRSSAGPHPRLATLREISLLAAFGALLAPALGATIGTTVVTLSTGATDWIPIWYTWWIGDVLGVLIVCPLILSAGRLMKRSGPGRPPGPIQLSALRVLEGAALAASLTVASYAIFHAGSGGELWTYLIIPLLLWAGLRFGLPAASAGAALTCVVGIASFNAGIETVELAPAVTATSVFQMQLFLTVATIIALTLAALVEQNREMTRQSSIMAEKYRVILESLPIGVTVSDPEGNIVENSVYADQILGISTQEQQSRSIDDPRWEIIHSDGRRYNPEEYGTVRALKTHEPAHDYDMGIVSELGVRWIDVTSIPLDLEGYGVVAAYADVTERHNALEEIARHRENLEETVRTRTAELEATNEELREASAAKSRFLASMSHELRTPLNSIIGFSGLMQQGLTGPLTPEQAVQIGMIKASGDHLLAMVNDILDLSRIEAGRTEITLTTFDVGDLVNSLTATLEKAAGDKGLELIVNLPSGPLQVRSDHAKLTQILLNLLDNAVKFTEHGSVTMSVELTDGHLLLQVVDTGIGISDEDLPRVMDEFGQIVDETGMKPQGTGLGLAIVSRLVVLLGGDLSVTSEPGVGSAFTVEVPVCAPC